MCFSARVIMQTLCAEECELVESTKGVFEPGKDGGKCGERDDVCCLVTPIRFHRVGGGVCGGDENNGRAVFFSVSHCFAAAHHLSN